MTILQRWHRNFLTETININGGLFFYQYLRRISAGAMVLIQESWQILRSALPSWQLLVASGYTHPSPGKAVGNMVITFSPVGALPPRTATHLEMLMPLMKAHPHGKNIKNVSGGAHLGWCLSLLRGEMSRNLALMCRCCSVPELTGLVSICRERLMLLWNAELDFLTIHPWQNVFI